MMENGIKKKRWTKQKKTIIDIVYESEVHLTADEIYSKARKILRKISLGTVYRDLMMLRDMGLISEVPKGSVNTYAKHPDSNVHFECEICHKLYCVQFDMSVFDLSKKCGFKVNRCSLNMIGVCNNCEKNQG
jgi:Fur family ferric uptake transcriptional regulator/Fur family peroxide stress response transcriptional regulator